MPKASMLPSRSREQQLAFALTFAAVSLATTLSAQSLNLVVAFTSSGGLFLEKLHPATLLLILAMVVLLIRHDRTNEPYLRNESDRDPRILVGLSASWLVLCVFLLFRGQLGYLAVVVNNFLTPLLFVYLSLRFTQKQLTRLANAILWILILNCFLIWTEFILGQTFLPTTQEASFFRPAGLAGHPIFAGMYCVIALLLFQISAYPVWLKICGSFFILSTISVVGVRGSLLLGFLLVISEVYLLRDKSGRRISFNARILTLFIPFLVFVGAYWIGALDRFATLGLWDDSAQSRFAAYDILGVVTDREYMTGIPLDKLPLYLEHFGLAYVESPFVAQFVAGGIVFAVASHMIMFTTILCVARHTRPLAVSIGFYTLTTLAFSSKTMLPLILSIVYVIARSHTRR